MPFEPRQPVRKEILLDPSERGDALGVAGQATVADRGGLPLCEQPLHGKDDVAELSGHPCGATDHPPLVHDPATEPGADDRGDRGTPVRLGAEMHMMRIERRGVAVVVVDDGQPDPVGQGTPEVEAAPSRLREVRRTLGGYDTVGTRRAWRVEPYRADGLPVGSGKLKDEFHRLKESVDRRVRPLLHTAGNLDEPVNKERPGAVQHRGIDAGATNVETDDYLWI